MYILEVSYGCPSKKYPLNGVFQMDQAVALSHYNHKVVYAAVDTRSIRRWRRWGISEHEWGAIPVIEFNFPIGPLFKSFSRIISRIGFRLALSRVIHEHGKPDIVHVHFEGTAESVVDACIKERIPYVVTEHSSSFNEGVFKQADIKRISKVYRNAAAVIAVSSGLAAIISRCFGIKAVVIPNIIDFSTFFVKRIPHDNFRIISAGNLIHRKGFDVLLKAFHESLKLEPNLQLLIMGRGPDANKLETIVKEYEMGRNVTFFGEYERAQFSEELSKSDLFVLASRGETFGVVYAESIASGVPVIATRCGGPEDFVDSSNGILVDIDDVVGLTDAILKMKRSIASYDSDYLASEIRTKFSEPTFVEKINAIFECICFGVSLGTD